MEKFLSIPVTSEQNQLVSCAGIKLIDAATATATTTVITYAGGKAVTLTHAAQVAFSMRDAIQNAMVAALQSQWQYVSHDVAVPQAVTAIVIA